MSSSRSARKFMNAVLKFQRISLQNKSSYEGPENKNFSWIPFGWSRASHQENFDGPKDSFNTTGIVADSIFVYANPEAIPLAQPQLESVVCSSDSKCPSQRMLDQQKSHTHPKLKDLYRRRRCEESEEVKDPLSEDQKQFIERLKRCPNTPPTLDNFQATAPQRSADVSLPGKAELVSELPYWVKAASAESIKNRLSSLRSENSATNWTKAGYGEDVKNADGYIHPKLRFNQENAKDVENISVPYCAMAEHDKYSTVATHSAVVENDPKSCQIQKNSAISQKLNRSSGMFLTNKTTRYFSSSNRIRNKERASIRRVKAPDRRLRAKENYESVFKSQLPSDKLEAPLPSYSECLLDSNLVDTTVCANNGNMLQGNGGHTTGAGLCSTLKPLMKRFSNAAATTSISCSSSTLAARISEPESGGSSLKTIKRFYSAKAKSENKKTCFAQKKKKIKENKEEDLSSSLSCTNPVIKGRCAEVKCGPESIPCKKPPPINNFRCPKKPKVVRMKKKFLKGPNIRPSFKVCKKPDLAKPFQCKPRVEVKIEKKMVETQKRCQCFAPRELSAIQPKCRKMPNAVEPNCNKPKRDDAPPTGTCPKKTC